MDMVRGNILFDTTADTPWQIDDVRLSGVIDFEKTAIGLPVCDMARTLAFLLVDCLKPADKISKYFIDSGYRKRGSMDIIHIELLPYFIRLFLLHDFYKFLRHTPYESLRDNYHYGRTCVILKDYGMISSKI
jgi:Ser/Thr protein kinase RdoA (MazF antagonist)